MNNLPKLIINQLVKPIAISCYGMSWLLNQLAFGCWAIASWLGKVNQKLMP